MMDLSATGRTSFTLRGLKGLWWEPEQYRGWPTFLHAADYNFFMLCYTFCPETGLRWRQPLREAERAVVRELAKESAARGITLCMALHPLIGGQAWAPEEAAVRFHPTAGRSWFVSYWQARRPGESLQPDRPIQYGSEEDLAILVRACQQAYALGVRAIALCLDDVDPGSMPPGFPNLAAAHLWLANSLRTALPDGMRLIVVPTYYWTDGAREQSAYTAGLAAGLPQAVDIFWTGQVVRDHQITAAKAREAATLFGRQPLVWLNYASNDSFRFAPQLPPDQPPSADLVTEAAGLLLNSTRQTGLAKLDALVIGAYLADPAGYDHASAVRAALVARAGEQAAPALARLLEAWRAVPDVRTLPADLLAGGRPFLETLLGRLGSALAVLDTVEPTLEAHTEDRQLWQELTFGIVRLRLLTEALAVLSADAGAQAAARSALLARLSTVDPEAACDAEAVLTLVPG
jgi:hypothetical protein